MAAPQQNPPPRPHPHLTQPLLYLSNLPPQIRDLDLANIFYACTPFKPQLEPATGTGTVAFKFFHSAEKALATLQSRPIPITVPAPPTFLSLSPYPPAPIPTPLPPPNATPRLVKNLPPDITDSDLYDLFRPFGSLASVRVNAGFLGGASVGELTSIVEFWFEDEARLAQEAMHCAEVGDSNLISVHIWTPPRPGAQNASRSPFDGFSPNVNAPAFVPTIMPRQPSGPYSPVRTHSQQFPPGIPSPPYSPDVGGGMPIVHGPGQQVQLAPMSGPGSTSHSGLIDPCNLFIKNLDAEIDSNILFSYFREFGAIVSARVMRNELGASRGFGFVSYQTPDQAAHALQAMNNMQLGSKSIIVRLHEPKQLRQEKLAQRFSQGGGSGHPRSGSGATSPSLSEASGNWPSPKMSLGTGLANMNLAAAPGGGSPTERARRSSGSYYNAALAGTLNLSMRYEDLSALSPVVRKEVLSGELSRRVKELPTTNGNKDVDVVVDTLIGLSLKDVVEGIHDPSKFAAQVQTAREILSNSNKLSAPESTGPSSRSSPSPAPSQDSTLLDPHALLATASAPEHPSTPLSISGSLSDPPRTSSPSGSIPAAASTANDRKRLLAEVQKLEPVLAEEITNLLMSLSKRERALCLFSAEILRAKVKEAREIVAIDDETEEPVVVPNSKSSAVGSATKPTPNRSLTDDQNRNTTSTSSQVHTIESLARLPATEVVSLAALSSTASGLPLPKADGVVIQATNEFIDGLSGQAISAQKQALGEKLFKFVKAAGAKNAGKITIQLLDTEDLRALAHLMNSYPAVLKEKVSNISKSVTK